MIGVVLSKYQFAFLALAFPVLLSSLAGCGQGGPSNSGAGGPGGLADEVSQAQLELPKDLPYNPIIKSTAPNLRHDAFYDAKALKDGKLEKEWKERFITNGHGFVAYSDDPGGWEHYYLYNYSGRTTLFIDTREHTLKPALTSMGDRIIDAYRLELDSNALPKEDRLGEKKFGKFTALGYLYKERSKEKQGEGEVLTENWFASQGPKVLVYQKISGPAAGQVLERTLSRCTPRCETVLLRIPQGFTLLK